MDRRRALTGGIVLAVILALVYFSISARSGTLENRGVEGKAIAGSATPTAFKPGPPLATSTAHAPASPTSTPDAPGSTATPPPTIVPSLPITTTQQAKCDASAAGSCAYNGLLRSGRLAFLDTNCVLNVIDPDSNQHWQSKLAIQSAHQPGLTDSDCQIRGWSDRTGELSAWVRVPDDAGTGLVFALDGQSVEQRPIVHPISAPDPVDDRSSLTTTAADGRTAWFDWRGIDWHLHVAAASGAETLDLPFASDDRIHQILAWVPSTDLLLVESTYASNGAMLYGGLLSTVDVTTGVTREIGLRTRWGDGEKSWNPLHPAIVDLIVTGTDREHSQAEQLAELDLGTGQIEYLTETSARTPLWSPDGTLLAYAMDTSDEPGLPSDEGDPGRSVIVVQDRFGRSVPGEPQVLAAGDAVLGWTADGTALIYARYADAERSSLELRMMTVDGGSDELIAANVRVPHCWSQCFWSWSVTYQP